jgi:hypothetical protein
VDGLVTHDIETGGETPASLVQALVGPGPAITNIQYTGRPIAAGTFSGGTGIVGFESGIILSSGHIARVVGPRNTDGSVGSDYEGDFPGDPDLDAVILPASFRTWDASVLEFDLECAGGTAISFQYVFSSDEYDFQGDFIDDVFACFVNGQNIALIPGTDDPITVNRVCNASRNSAFYITNDCWTLGLGYPCSHIATEMDGLTVVLSATGVLQPGLNHVKLAIADGGDTGVDSNVFIRAQSLVCSPGVPVFETTSMCALVLDGWSGAPFSLDVSAWAANLPGAAVSLDVTGDAIPLAGGTFLPPLPTSPAQPGSTQFQWTPTLADVGLYHLVFTATDQVQQSASLDVPIRISIAGMPAFDMPSPCAQTLDAFAEMPFSFAVRASAWTSPGCGSTNGPPGASVTLSVTGDTTPLAGGTFLPPLPAGPAQPVTTQFHWTPTLADVGLYHLYFTAIDQLQQSASCDVTIRVLGSPGIDLCQAGVGTVSGCPCSNPPAVSPGGCDNSAGTGGARLESTGRPQTAYSTVVFTTTGETPTALSIVLQGKAFLPNGVIYGQGVRCVGVMLKRLYVKSASGGSITAPQPGDMSVYDRSEQAGDIIMPGTSRYYSVYYRDPTILGSCPATSTFNVTQTQQILWPF